MKKILTVIGARPQFIKAAPLSKALLAWKREGVEEILLHTGQHYDAQLSGIFFDELGLPQPKYQLNVGSLSHGAQTARMLEGIENVILKEKSDMVLVYGDTNSTLAGALAAAKLNVSVAHVEAGLRSFNKRMPEEINRIMTDHISSLLFAPTELSVNQLLHEGIGKDKIIRTGDIMLDASLMFSEISDKESTFLEENGLTKGKYVLATIHRAENTDSEQNLTNIVSALSHFSENETVVFPIHPRTKHLFDRFGVDISTSKIKFIEPLGYLDMIAAEKNARLILTDSGGVQKEAYFYKVPCFTFRNETEWKELVDLGVNRLVDVSSVDSILKSLNQGFDVDWHKIPSVYGDGTAAQKIALELGTHILR